MLMKHHKREVRRGQDCGLGTAGTESGLMLASGLVRCTEDIGGMGCARLDKRTETRCEIVEDTEVEMEAQHKVQWVTESHQGSLCVCR